jgi:hypothetical protein
MIVPQYWAEARLQNRDRKRQVTVRRFGWSDLSQADAQRHADDRARDAMARILAGERLERRDHKVPYNGADGLPIREEIVARHGDSVITRNSYGALCLNTPDVLFADIDFGVATPGSWFAFAVGGMLIATIVAAVNLRSWVVFAIGSIMSVIVGAVLAERAYRFRSRLAGSDEDQAMNRIRSFAAANPEWRLRIYRTPAGLRVLVVHRTFHPAEEAVQRCFSALGVDPIYRRMCLNQKCFRARLTAKPWRIGISEHIRPRPGVWPVSPERLPDRRRWLDDYDRVSNGYAACRFVEDIGVGSLNSKAAIVQRLHDEMCRADSGLELA